MLTADTKGENVADECAFCGKTDRPYIAAVGQRFCSGMCRDYWLVGKASVFEEKAMGARASAETIREARDAKAPPPSPGVREQALAWSKELHCGNCGEWNGVSGEQVEREIFACDDKCAVMLKRRLRLERQRDATRTQMSGETMRETLARERRVTRVPDVPDSTVPVEVRGDGLDKIIASLKSERSTRDYYLDEAAKDARDGLSESARQCLDVACVRSTRIAELEYCLKTLGVEEP